jgi:hypothetical protein
MWSMSLEPLPSECIRGSTWSIDVRWTTSAPAYRKYRSRCLPVLPTLNSMAVVPFHEPVVAHWYDEVERARQELAASLDDLRAKADGYLTVSALATTLFAVLTPDRHSNGSVRHAIDPLPETATGREPRPSPPDIQGVSLIALGPTGNGSGSYPDEQRDVVRPSAPGRVAGPSRETALDKAITSPNRTVATVGVPLSFTVTTTGTPVPSITSKGVLPGYVMLMNNGDGTATISGTPRTTGVFHFTVKSRFGKRTAKYVVMQSFTLTVRR